MAESSTCGDATDYVLKYIAVGSKSCGGPTGYLAYSTSIDIEELEKLVKKHAKLQADYNKKWNIISTCDTPREPTTVNCNNGKPILIYAQTLY